MKYYMNSHFGFKLVATFWGFMSFQYMHIRIQQNLIMNNHLQELVKLKSKQI